MSQFCLFCVLVTIRLSQDGSISSCGLCSQCGRDLGFVYDGIVSKNLYSIGWLLGKNLRKTSHIKKSGENQRFLESADDFFHKRDQESFYRYQRIILCALVNTVRLTLLFSLPFLVGLALHIPLEWPQMLDVIALSSFVTMANSFIPIPGASGGTEVVFNLLFSQ